jgi:hypothetical protein
MSLARQHRAYHEALAAARPDEEGGLAPLVEAMTEAAAGVAAATGREHVLAMARLTNDRRRLEEIQSIERKIEAKRGMLPEYGDYIAGVLAAGAAGADPLPDDVIAYVMVWSIDTGAFPAALSIAEHMIGHQLPMPAKFQRTTATLVAEEMAEAAIKALATPDTQADLDTLLAVDELVADQDMPDEVRAKLKKALGLALVRRAEQPDEGSGIAGVQRAAQDQALAAFRRAVELDGRVGVKKQIEQLEKALKKTDAPAGSAPSDPGTGGDTPPTASPDAGPDGADAPPAAG